MSSLGSRHLHTAAANRDFTGLCGSSRKAPYGFTSPNTTLFELLSKEYFSERSAAQGLIDSETNSVSPYTTLSEQTLSKLSAKCRLNFEVESGARPSGLEENGHGRRFPGRSSVPNPGRRHFGRDQTFHRRETGFLHADPENGGLYRGAALYKNVISPQFTVNRRIHGCPGFSTLSSIYCSRPLARS
jgi:hypothetical protein